MTSQKRTLILTTYPFETGMYVETDVFWNVKPCRLMDRFLWNCGRCHTRDEHNSNTQCCGSSGSHKHMILSDLSNVHNSYYDIQLTERRLDNSDKGLGQTQNHDPTTVVHRKLQENIPLNISSRPCSALRNNWHRDHANWSAACTGEHYAKIKAKHKRKRKTQTLEAVQPTSHTHKMQPVAFWCYECYRDNASCKTDMRHKTINEHKVYCQ
jgi:hypothetical protein